jgi:cytidine deaminase
MKDKLFNAAREVMARAHAPYSKFLVGAAILAEDGKIYQGCNIENASYPEGWCAETSAISNMVSSGQTTIVEIAVIAEKMPGVTPCGGCCQRIAEFANADVPVHLCDEDGVIETIKLGDLLPKSFSLNSQE